MCSDSLEKDETFLCDLVWERKIRIYDRQLAQHPYGITSSSHHKTKS